MNATTNTANKENNMKKNTKPAPKFYCAECDFAGTPDENSAKKTSHQYTIACPVCGYQEMPND
jgi:transcription elongation factor Elf1